MKFKNPLKLIKKATLSKTNKKSIKKNILKDLIWKIFSRDF